MASLRTCLLQPSAGRKWPGRAQNQGMGSPQHPSGFSASFTRTRKHLPPSSTRCCFIACVCVSVCEHMCVCLCASVSVHMPEHMCVCTRMHACTHVYACSVLVRMSLCTSVHRCVCPCLHVYLYVCMCVHVFVCDVPEGRGLWLPGRSCLQSPFCPARGCYSVKRLSPQGFLLRLTAMLMSVPGALTNGRSLQ